MCGAREGQMPNILTMIHTEKSTPVPSVICLTLMCLCYLCSSDLILLMNYVGFSTWLAIGFAMILASIPVYVVFIMWKSKPMWVRNILGEVTDWLQRLLVVMPQEKTE